jgi:hypothetical protein
MCSYFYSCLLFERQVKKKHEFTVTIATSDNGVILNISEY